MKYGTKEYYEGKYTEAVIKCDMLKFALVGKIKDDALPEDTLYHMCAAYVTAYEEVASAEEAYNECCRNEAKDKAGT